jgi:glycosyltransferase involved in cell wall biosynthesis
MTGRLLFLSHRLPFPPHSGAAIRTYNVLVALSREYSVDALCFDRKDQSTAGISVQARIEALRPFARCEVFPIPQQRSRRRLLWDHARSALTGRPYTYYVHDSKPFLRRLSEVLRERTYDVVHVESLDLVRVMSLLPLERVACTHHNVESELLARRARVERNHLRRAYTRVQADLVRRAERRWAPRVACNLCTSAEDLRALEVIAPGMRGEIIPNGVDDAYFTRDDVPRDGGLVFVGGTSWHPNRDALEWFIDAILPALRASGVSAPVTWVGRVTPEERARYGGIEGFTLTGYVDDIRPYLARARCFVAPIRFGGGTRLKMLDAWAMQLPVVATRAAMEGLDPADGSDCLIAEAPSEFAAQIQRVLADESLANRLGAAGRARIEQSFAWRTIGEKLRVLYRDVATRAARTTPSLR